MSKAIPGKRVKISTTISDCRQCMGREYCDVFMEYWGNCTGSKIFDEAFVMDNCPWPEVKEG